MNDQFEPKITNISVVQIVKGGLRNSPAHNIGMAYVSRLDLDHFALIQFNGQLDSPSFDQRLPKLKSG